jgi:hypothetical protein
MNEYYITRIIDFFLLKKINNFFSLTYTIQAVYVN